VALVAPSLFKTTTADFKQLILSLFFIPSPDPQAPTDWRPLYKLGWTLNYEMFFYAGLLTLFWCRRSLHRSLILTAALGALILFSFSIPQKRSVLAFYANIALIPFLVGVWMAEFSAAFERIPRWGVAALVIASTISLAWFYQVPFTSLRALDGHLAMTLAASLLVATGLACESRFPRRGFVQMVGNSSYSLYLTHMFVVGAAWAVIGGLDLPDMLKWSFAPLIAAAALLAAYCSYHVIEMPFNRLAHRRVPRPIRHSALAELSAGARSR
jgi:exopolysaccharide production protein ExoZ